MSKLTKKEKWIMAVMTLAVFAAMFAFFFTAHPIVILDSDDWQYISYSRPAVPYTNFWNPARILPEILMPACGSLAAVLYHFGAAGYIESQMLVFSAVLSAFIAFYILAFTVLIKKRFSLPVYMSVALGIFFLLLHFLIFRNAKSDNLYMFWSYDATCVFYYTIPSLLCCTLVMYFESSGILENFFSANRILLKSLLVIAIYLAVFSNLFNSVIIAVYMAYEIIRSRKIKLMPLMIVLLWAVSLIFEALGGRGSVSMGDALNLKDAFNNLLTDFSSFSIYFELLLLAIPAFSLVLLFALKKKNSDMALSLRPHLFAFFAISVFEVLLCAKVNALYMLRPQVFFGTAFAIFMMICICLAYILKEMPRLFLAVPVLLLVMLSVTNTQEITFAESNTMNLPWQTCVRIDNDIISQVVEADKAGLEKMTLDVMDTGVDDNWPHTSYTGVGISQSLYKHGLTGRKIEIDVHWSLDFNERNGLNITEFSEDRY